jgi:iron complex outermembrane receptor protein
VKTKTIAHLLGGSSIFLATLSVAQQSTPAAGDQLETILVTAQKRSESLQDVPLSVTAFGENQIESQRLFNINEIARQTPSFIISGITPSQPVLTIRGVGSTDPEAGSDRSVVPFVDEIYVGRTSAATFDIFDLERVEVLRGPQGTLFGRNVSGGAINITTAKPQDEYDAKLEATVGNYDRTELRGMVNTPLSDNWAARFTLTSTHRNGFYDNVNLGKDGIEAPTNLDGRAQLTWNDHDGQLLLLSASEWDDKVDGIAAKVYCNQISQTACAKGLKSFWNAAAGPQYQPIPGDFNVQNGVVGFSNTQGSLLNARYERDLGFGTLTEIPAWLHNHLNEVRDEGGIPVIQAGPYSAGFFADQNQHEVYDSYTNELRISSPSTDSSVTWVTGVYLLKEHIDRIYDLPRQVNNSLSHINFVEDERNTSKAAFGQADWRFLRTFDLTLGIRYTSDYKKLDNAVVNKLTPADIATITAQYGRAPGLAPATATYAGEDRKGFTAWTPKVALSWKPTDEENVYASWTRGFKDGGFTGTAPNLEAFHVGFLPETVDSYEVGVKSLLLQRSVRLNFSAFYYDYNNLQLSDRHLLAPNDITTAVAIVINAGRATSEGLELEGEWLVTPDLKLGFESDVLDTRINAVAAGSTLFVGKQLPRSPGGELGLNASYMLDAAKTGLPVNLELAGDYKWTAHYYFLPNENLATKQPAFHVLNAHLAVSWPQSNWSLNLWGKNITNTHYFSGINNSGVVDFVNFGDPATFGATLLWRR